MFTNIVTATVVLLLLAGCTGPSPDLPTADSSAASAAPGGAPSAAPPDGSIAISATSPDLVHYDRPIPPVRLQLSSADIDVRVVPVAIEQGGFMELPERVDLGGWYRFGSSPTNATGNTVIASHVDSFTYGLGPFVRIKDVKPGASVVVTTEGGERHRYEVTSVKRIDKGKLPVDSLFSRDGEPALVLITCGGQFDTTTRTYSDNVVLTAVRVQN